MQHPHAFTWTPFAPLAAISMKENRVEVFGFSRISHVCIWILETVGDRKYKQRAERVLPGHQTGSFFKLALQRKLLTQN